jgi:hypothetical protein
MEEDMTRQSADLSDMIDMVQCLIEQTDEKIREASPKIKAAEHSISTTL